MSTSTETHEPSITQSEGRLLDSGEREYMLDVRTQDMEVNMGPQHPATHGVMRVLIRCDGELVTGAQPHLGYLHRCAEGVAINTLPFNNSVRHLAGAPQCYEPMP